MEYVKITAHSCILLPHVCLRVCMCTEVRGQPQEMFLGSHPLVFFFFFLIFSLLSVHVWWGMCHSVCVGLKTTLWTCFSPSSFMWVLEFKHRLSGLSSKYLLSHVTSSTLCFETRSFISLEFASKAGLAGQEAPEITVSTPQSWGCRLEAL